MVTAVLERAPLSDTTNRDADYRNTDAATKSAPPATPSISHSASRRKPCLAFAPASDYASSAAAPAFRLISHIIP
ncbi:MAG: hypothetical protein FWD68_06600 [Alphaproteobacteria bacterium]|nr:hypothetical protein [Alphaproteobacteria bacterium]